MGRVMRPYLEALARRTKAEENRIVRYSRIDLINIPMRSASPRSITWKGVFSIRFLATVRAISSQPVIENCAFMYQLTVRKEK
jgi:hypothetical protein